MKHRFVGYLSGIRRALAVAGVQPDAVSIAAVPVIVAVGAALAAGRLNPLAWLLVPPLCLVWMGINAIDGDLARTTGATSSRGAALNELIDRFGDLVVIAAGFFVAPGWLVAGAAIAVFSAEIISLISWGAVGDRNLVGPMGKPDRAMMLSMGAVLAVAFPAALAWSYGVIAAGAAIAAAIRLRSLFAATDGGRLGRAR